MLPKTNRQVRLKSRPNGIPQAQHCVLTAAAVLDLRDRGILVRNDFLSVDPAMRGWVNAAANLSKPVGISEVMRALAAGEVVASIYLGYAEGDRIMGLLGWQDHSVSDGSSISRKIKETDLLLSLAVADQTARRPMRQPCGAAASASRLGPERACLPAAPD